MKKNYTRGRNTFISRARYATQMRKNWFSLFKSSIKTIYIPCIFKPNFQKHISLLYQSQTKFLRSSANTSQYGLHSLRVFSSKVCKMDSFIQGWNPPPPPFSEGMPPLSGYPLFLKQIWKNTPSFWEPSKLVHANCIKHFKMKELHFILYYTYWEHHYHYSLYFQVQLCVYYWLFG